ncbi:hypothetical protein GPL02_13685 [Clostridium sp. MCC334]|nr:hypothetical protein [Clostridium sp. MCC334]
MSDNNENQIISGWKYYNHAMIPTCEPHEIPNLKPLQSGTLLKNRDVWGEDRPLFARWTEDYDCGYETTFWYCIKDDIFDISALKSKRRYEIKKGLKNFDVKVIDPFQYSEQLYDVAVMAFSAYPEAYRPKIEKRAFINGIDEWTITGSTVFGAFDKESGRLCGYAQLIKQARAINFNIEKTIPEFESKGVNAAICMAIVLYYQKEIEKGYYIVDGARAISHETHFQDYLEKYFGFRRAYCHLHVKYKWWVLLAVKALYPFRTMIEKSKSSLAHNITAVLRMEEWKVRE